MAGSLKQLVFLGKIHRKSPQIATYYGDSKLRDAAFLLTIGSFLLTAILAFLLTVGAFLLTILASLLTVGAFLLTVGKCISFKGLKGL